MRNNLSARAFLIPVALAIALLLLIHTLQMSVTVSAQGGDAKKPTTPPKASPPKTQPKPTTRRSPTRTNSGGNATAVEIAFWNSIKDSTNPDDYRAYLKKYPDGQFVQIAQNRINSLETAAKEDAARKEEAKKAAQRPGAVVKNQLGMELVYVPAGSFMMGFENGNDNEKPVHRVTISNGFYMGRYEVTQAQWQAVMGNNPSNFKGDNLPVEQVSWTQAQWFIQKLNEMNDGYVYRLPTGAEWEYACRAGTTGDYAGNLDAMAWYYENAGDARLSGEWNEDKAKANNNRTHPVGQKQPNAFGLYDMLGNVDEWCEDWYHESYNGAPTDGSAWVGGAENKFLVIRGGSWISHAKGLRPSSSGLGGIYANTSDLGFRVAASAR